MTCNKKIKALTFSFDDGVLDDVRLVKLFNKYGLKSTFNLNSALLTSNKVWRYKDTKDVAHINYYDYPDLYEGHEVACHGYTHPHLEELDGKTADNEIRLDKRILENLYNCKVRGMAYPYGTHSDQVVEILKENGIEYGRTIEGHFRFDIPQNPLLWDPTCHFQNKELMELAEKFVNLQTDQALFYVWGHSYEFVTESDWQRFEEFCKFISFRDDIIYCTNIQFLDILKNIKAGE